MEDKHLEHFFFGIAIYAFDVLMLSFDVQYLFEAAPKWVSSFKTN